MTTDDTYLRDRSDLYDLALAYARCADRRDFEGFREIFTEKGQLRGYYGDPKTSKRAFFMDGLDAIAGGMHGLKDFGTTLHTVSNQYIEIDGDNAAGETYCVAHHISTKGGTKMNYTMFIRYEDQFERVASRWYISDRTLLCDFSRNGPLQQNPTD